MTTLFSTRLKLIFGFGTLLIVILLSVYTTLHNNDNISETTKFIEQHSRIVVNKTKDVYILTFHNHNNMNHLFDEKCMFDKDSLIDEINTIDERISKELIIIKNKCVKNTDTILKTIEVFKKWRSDRVVLIQEYSNNKNIDHDLSLKREHNHLNNLALLYKNITETAFNNASKSFDDIEKMKIKNKEYLYIYIGTMLLIVIMLSYFITHNITRSERKLSERKKQWQTTFDSISDSVSIIDINGRILQYNSATLKMFNINENEIKNKYCYELVHGTTEYYENCPLSRMKSSNKLEKMIFKEEDRWLEVTVYPIFNKNEILTGSVHVVSNITNQKEAEVKLLKEKKKSDRYLDIADVILLSIQSDGIVKLINRKGCEILGYSKEDIIGKNWFDNFIPERNRDTIKKVSKKVFSGQMEAVKYFENEVILKSGEQRTIAWHNAVLKDDYNNIIGTLSSGEDITEKKKNEMELNTYRLHLEEKIEERTAELEKKNKELEEFNSLFVGREYRINELKEKLKKYEK